MPGIVGIISQRPMAECASLVRSMVGAIEVEPFYRSGTHFVSEMGIYAGWVTLENTPAADQVFFNEHRTITLLFSGECFLDASDRAELRWKGHEINSNSLDWLVHLYEEEGDRFFEKLNGLFSGLLIDREAGKAFLFNDRYGVERIYVHERDDELYFASEAKALLAVLPDSRAFDQEGVLEFFTFGCTSDARTLFHGIRNLPGGSLWSFGAHGCRKTHYFSAGGWESLPLLSTDAFLCQFESTFKRVLPRYFEASSRVGIALTAGLDTRMIMACFPPAGQKPVSFTFSGQNRDTLDARVASRVAEKCGIEHHILRVEPDFFSDFGALVDRTVYSTDGYFDSIGAHEIYMNARARQLAGVRLTGNYGSEVLRGVRRFKPVGISSSLFSSEIADAVVSRSQKSPGTEKHRVSFAVFREIPYGRFGELTAGKSQLAFRTPYLDNELVQLTYQAPETMRMSSVAAIHLIRANSRELSEIATSRGLLGKANGVVAAAKRAFYQTTFKLDYLYNEGMPHWFSRGDSVFRYIASRLGVLGLHKHMHYRSWFRRELAGCISERLNDPHILNSPLWNRKFVATLAENHIRGTGNYVREINAVLTIEAIERLLFRKSWWESLARDCAETAAAAPLTRAWK